MEISSTWQEIVAFIENLFELKLFEINQTPITAASLLMFIVFVILVFIFSRLLNRLLLRRILKKFEIDPGARYNMVRVSHYLIMTAGTIMAFQFVGIDLSGLAVVLGFLSVGIGFGLQNITSNFISGLILLFERPISVGDRVTVGDTEGDVQAIRMRATTIQTLNNISIIVPNSEFISSQVINWSHGDPKIRLDIPVGVSYHSDLEKVVKALNEVAANHPRILKHPAHDVLFLEFGDSSWNLELRVWLAHPKGNYEVRSQLNMGIVKKFKEYNIEIPFPQRDLHVRSPLPVPLDTTKTE